MSEPMIFGDLPTGRRLDQPTGPDGVGSISMFPRATPERVHAMRQRLPEVTLDRRADPWTDESGREYELVRGLLDISDPASRGATAFEVTADAWIVPLRPAGTVEEVRSVRVGP